METIRLKSRIGPTTLTIRGQDEQTLEQTVHEAKFSFENDFRDDVPSDWWEEHASLPFGNSHLKYNEAFFPL